MKKEKMVVAYSGGLDTSVMVKWISEHYDAEVITATGDLGQGKELEGVKEKALATGAVKAYVQDLTAEFVDQYVVPALKAGALYEGVYPMATALGRPLLAKYMVEIARAEGATTIVHGCTGKGNDQVRFEVSIGALAPELKVIGPVRHWEFKSREEEVVYAQKHGIPVAATKKSPYSIDDNLWGTAIECGVLEDPMVEPPADAYQHTVDAADAPNTPEYVDIAFIKGVPAALNGEPMSALQLIKRLNGIGGAHGVGRIDLVENRLVGIKSREVYEAPAAVILHTAHKELERLTLDKAVFTMKNQLAAEYAQLVYNGLWFSPLRNALAAFGDETQKTVSGTVRMKLYKGTAVCVGRGSVHSLYNAQLATYTEEDTFDHKASEGFIKIFGLPLKTYYQVERKQNGGAKKAEKKQTAAVPS